MMSHFKEFCEAIHKTKAGHVPDLLDLESDFFRDLAMGSFLSDRFSSAYGDAYIRLSSNRKNLVYAVWESQCQDAIDAYNQAIDDAREADSMMDYLRDDPLQCLYDPDYKFARFNQAEIDAGYSGTGREFC
jgi:hypothetical protein